MTHGTAAHRHIGHAVLGAQLDHGCCARAYGLLKHQQQLFFVVALLHCGAGGGPGRGLAEGSDWGEGREEWKVGAKTQAAGGLSPGACQRRLSQGCSVGALCSPQTGKRIPRESHKLTKARLCAAAVFV